MTDLTLFDNPGELKANRFDAKPLDFDAYLTPPLLDTDSYKLSHHKMYPPDMTAMFHYLEARPGGWFKQVRFVGLFYILHGLLHTIEGYQVDEMVRFGQLHGVEVPGEALMGLALRGGALPLRIRALPEGTIVPEGTPLMTVESTDPAVPWLGGLVETMLMRVWYPTTVATLSWHIIHRIIRPAMEQTCTPELLEELMPSRLHDFGSRGVSSQESAALGGFAHLTNSTGSDTVEGILFANRFYGEEMAGYSLPAMEHSTVTSWGREHEADAFQHAIEVYGGPGKLISLVVDSYDPEYAVREIIGNQLREFIIASGSVVVVRPDSGNPVEMVRLILSWLGEDFGYTVNEKGYRVLHPSVRVIQGDGLTDLIIRDILEDMLKHRWSAENIVFGMGGALLQGVHRDSQRIAYKASAVKVDGEWQGVQKNPKSDPSKASKAGRLDVIWNGTAYQTVTLDPDQTAHPDSVMETVFENGEILVEPTLAEIRARGERK